MRIHCVFAVRNPPLVARLREVITKATAGMLFEARDVTFEDGSDTGPVTLVLIVSTSAGFSSSVCRHPRAFEGCKYVVFYPAEVEETLATRSAMDALDVGIVRYGGGILDPKIWIDTFIYIIDKYEVTTAL